MAEPDFTEISNRDGLLRPFSIETSGLTWMAVHGVICLGLRHPGYVGPSRAIVLSFVRELGRELLDHGVLTSEELALVERTEQLAP
jgi:hypothetical protein